MSQHTKEPWRQGKYVSQAVCADHLGEDVIVVEPFDASSEGPVLPVMVQQSNARRIVACVNACAGFGIDELELINDKGLTLSEMHDLHTTRIAALTDAKFEALPTDGLVWVCLNAEGFPGKEVNARLGQLIEALRDAKEEGRTNARFILTASLWPGQMQIQALPDDELARIGLIRDYVAKGLREELVSALTELLEHSHEPVGSDVAYLREKHRAAVADARAVIAKARGAV